MKLLSISSILILLAGNAIAQKRPVDGIAAQVGDNIILISDIESQKLQAIQSGMEITKEMECEILEGLMYQELLLNQAILDSIVVTDEQVDSEMESRLRLIEEQIGGRDKLEAFYGKTVTQLKIEFREIIRERLLSQEMERQITADISVTPKDVKDFFNSLPSDSIPFINSQLSFQQIVYYPVVTKEDKVRCKEELQGILEQARSGRSFSTLARLNSDDPGSASQGGEIEARRGMMVAPFEATVFSLKEGEISDVFETEYGYHIVKLISRKGDNYKCAHILKIPRYTDHALEQAAYKMDSCYRELKENKITWEDAVIKYSNDDATRQNKGIITNPYTGQQKWDMEDLSQVDQQIFRLTDKLDKGDITEPSLYISMIERKEGVRIVRLMDRTSPHKANLKDDYSLIQMATENEMKQRVLDEWVTKKIKNAYVRIAEPYQNCNFNHDWLSQ